MPPRMPSRPLFGLPLLGLLLLLLLLGLLANVVPRAGAAVLKGSSSTTSTGSTSTTPTPTEANDGALYQSIEIKQQQQQEVTASSAGGLPSFLPLGTLAADEPLASAMAPASAPNPYSWSNWEDTVRCQPAFLAFPASVDEVVALVKSHKRVRVVGLGHSFNQLACSTDLMLSTTQLDGVLELDTKQHTVTTQAGIKTRRLLDWLADHGYTLPTVPFFVDQTIGGVVSTASHGSSLTLGSVSSLVRAMKVVLADGTIKIITEADGDLMQAARTTVGLLGVIVEVTLAVVKDEVVKRETSFIHDDDLLRDLKLAAAHSLPYDRVQYWYAAPIKTAVKTRLESLHGHHHHHHRHTHPDVGRAMSDLYQRTIKGSPYERLFLRLQAGLMKGNDTEAAATYNMWMHSIYSGLPGYYKLSAAWPVQQQTETEVLRQVYGSYDQYEWAVALDKAHGCFAALFDMMDRGLIRRDDFPVPFCLRFVGGPKEGFLGQSHGGARFYLNLDSYYRTYQPNGFSQSLQSIKDLMMSPTCQARMHFGKAGMFSRKGGAWTSADAKYAAATYDAEAVARFRKVIREYDPQGKFNDVDGLLSFDHR